MSLAFRLLLLTLLAGIPVVLIEVGRELELRTDRINDSIDAARDYARLTAARTDRFIEGTRVLVTAAARLDAVRSRDPEGCMRELARMAAALPEFPTIAAFDPSGNTHCASVPTPQINIGDRPYFQATLQQKQFQVSDYVVGRQTGSGTVAFTYPALDDDGTVVAVMLMFTNSLPLSELLNDPPIPQGAFVALIDRSGTVAARWPEPEKWVGQSVANAMWARAGLEHHERGTVSMPDVSQYAVGFAALQAPANFTVAMGLPLAPALEQSKAQFDRAVGLTVGVFALAAVAVLLIAIAWVGKPVLALRDAADAMAQGNLQVRPPKASIPEIRALSEHFVAMAEALETRMRQKDFLVHEVNHRVKNSLQLVASMFALHRAHIRDGEARRQFDEAAAKVATVARVHQRLYIDEHMESIAFGAFLREMCGELSTALTINGAQPAIHCEAVDCRLSTDQAIPLALIVHELITNAFKYAYPDNGPGSIDVACTMDEAGVTISVSDQGSPLPEDFSVAMSPGLGMRMVSVLLQQLRGTLDVVRHARGKSFVVRVPA